MNIHNKAETYNEFLSSLQKQEREYFEKLKLAKSLKPKEWDIFDSSGRFRGIVVGTKLQAKRLAIYRGYYRARIKRRKS